MWIKCHCPIIVARFARQSATIRVSKPLRSLYTACAAFFLLVRALSPLTFKDDSDVTALSRARAPYIFFTRF